MNPHHQHFRRRVLVATLLTAALTPYLARASDLPHFDNVRGVRSARIAHLGRDHVRELETLRQIVAEFPDDISSLYALLQFHEEHPTSEVGKQALRDELTETLTRAGRDVPLDVLALVAAQHDDPAALTKVANELERRVAGPLSRDRATLETLFQLRVRQEDTLAATETLEKLLVVQAVTTNRRRLLRLYRHDERWHDAAGLVKAWLEIEPSLHLRAAYVDLLSRLGRLEELDRQIHLLLDQSTEETLFGRQVTYARVLDAAWNLRDAGIDEAAEALFRHIATLDPTDEEAASAVAHLYSSEEDRQRLRAAESKRWSQETDSQALFDEGTLRLAAGDIETAFPLLQRAAPGLPNLEPAWYNLGMAAYRLEKWQMVAEAFGRAARLNDSRAQTFLYRGLALEKLDRCAEAVEALDRAVALDASRIVAHYYLASCYARLDQPDDAARHRQLYEAAQ